MKKTFAVCLILFAASAFAVPALELAAAGRVLPTDHYEIHYIPQGGTEMSEDDLTRQDAIARQMEERFALYNDVFRFDPERLIKPLMVTAFEDSEEYANYIMLNLGREQAGAVYLHYDEAAICELIFCIDSGDGMDSFSYQSFIQFLRAFVPNPPAWIMEGFAVFFASVSFDENGELVYEENLAWLDTIKNMELPPLDAIMTADTAEAEEIEHFQALAWSLVSFFFSSNKGDYRSIIESFMVLSDTNTTKENTDAVMNRITKWNSIDNMTKDYQSYLEVRQTFNEMIEEGQHAYANGKPRMAEDAFRRALETRPGHYAPWYYLGLLAYDSGDTESAEKYYRSAMQYGADNALILYALGLNAAAAGKNSDAKEFLRQSAEAEPDRYREKAEALIAKLK